MGTPALVKWLTDYSSPRSFGSYLRYRRSDILRKLIVRIHAVHGRVDILDLGGTREYWNILPPDTWERFHLTVTVVNHPEIIDGMDKSGTHFVLRKGDACNLAEISDRSFHLTHSNSVLEHVGGREAVSQFCREMRRTGEAYYLQTPDFNTIFEPHFFFPCFHRLPLRLRVFLLRHFTLGFFDRQREVRQALQAVRSIRLLRESELRELFPEGMIRRERFCGLRKSLIVSSIPFDR